MTGENLGASSHNNKMNACIIYIPVATNRLGHNINGWRCCFSKLDRDVTCWSWISLENSTESTQASGHLPVPIHVGKKTEMEIKNCRKIETYFSANAEWWNFYNFIYTVNFISYLHILSFCSHFKFLLTA